ncbi:MAG: MFS transporter [Cyanobacteria bacterium]|nr:MFS transporter [Cyanobacteriota bacterium]
MERKQTLLAYLLETPNFLSIFLYPVFLISISPVLLDISNELHINLDSLNLIISFLIIGNIIGQLTSAFLNIKIRRFFIIIASYILLIPITLLLIFITRLYLFYILYFISGYILGVIWIQANGFLLESNIENKNRLVNIALIFFPVGAIFAPSISIIISNLRLNWRYLYILTIIFIVLILLAYILMKRKDNPSKKVNDEKVEFKGIFMNKNYNKIFIISILMLFFYGITEAVIYTWSPTFFRIDKALSAKLAGYTLMIFWFAVTLGRALVSTILCRIKPYIMALWLSVISLVSLFFMVIVSNGYFIFLTIFFVGLGYSGIFPLIFSTSSLIYPKDKGILETILFVITSLGASLAPYLTGMMLRLNAKYSISIALIFMALISFLLIINIINYKRFVRNQNVC